MTKDKLIADSMTALVDCKYALANTSQGWDCLNSLKQFYDACGIDFPTTFGDWNEKNYAEKWLEDPEIARQTLFAFLSTLGRPVDKNRLLRGDLLILRHQMKEKPTEESIPLLEKIKRTHPFMKKIINAVLEGRQLLTFPAIYLGNGHIFIIFEAGGKVLPFKFFEKYIVDARRLIE